MADRVIGVRHRSILDYLAHRIIEDVQFAKGTSGNLSGRPKGSRNQSTLLLEALFEEEGPQLAHKVIELGKGGNTRALEFCLRRLIPPHEDRLVDFDLPPIQSLNDIPLGMMSIEAAFSQGTLTLQEGEAFSRILTAHANALGAADVLHRVEKLEEGPSDSDNQVTILKEYRS